MFSECQFCLKINTSSITFGAVSLVNLLFHLVILLIFPEDNLQHIQGLIVGLGPQRSKRAGHY